MSFSSRRRNYLLTPHRRDGLIEWMKSMLQHSFVLDSLDTSGADTFEHFEMLIEEHRMTMQRQQQQQFVQNPYTRQPSRLQQLVPTIGTFHTPLPLRAAFELYNDKYKLTKRKHIQISFNEIRHIMNLAQIMALRQEPLLEELVLDRKASLANAKSDLKHLLSESSVWLSDLGDEEASSSQQQQQDQQSNSNAVVNPPALDDVAAVVAEEKAPLSPVLEPFNGPKLISFDGDQTLYSDGANFDSNPRLAHYLCQLLKQGVYVAVVTAAGYEYQVEKYEFRLSGLLHYFQAAQLTAAECDRFYLMGGECNYLMQLKKEGAAGDYKLYPVKERGPGGWFTATQHVLSESPANWNEEDVQNLLDLAQNTVQSTMEELDLRARIIRKKRSVGLVPQMGQEITRESLDETVLRCHEMLQSMNNGEGARLPYCSFNGGTDAWVDVGNKRVGVQVLQAFLGIEPAATLHIGDQFLNTGNDYAARAVSPCVWIISPIETTYILKSILRLAGVSHVLEDQTSKKQGGDEPVRSLSINFSEVQRRSLCAKKMDVYTGDMIVTGK